jgi:hypothetical protein
MHPYPTPRPPSLVCRATFGSMLSTVASRKGEGPSTMLRGIKAQGFPFCFKRQGGLISATEPKSLETLHRLLLMSQPRNAPAGHLGAASWPKGPCVMHIRVHPHGQGPDIFTHPSSPHLTEAKTMVRIYIPLVATLKLEHGEAGHLGE